MECLLINLLNLRFQLFIFHVIIILILILINYNIFSYY